MSSDCVEQSCFFACLHNFLKVYFSHLRRKSVLKKKADKRTTCNNLSKANEKSFHQNTVDSNLKAMWFSSLFGSIAVLSFLGNLLLCLVICRRRKLLSKPYNILMLNLAATDMLIGLNFFNKFSQILVMTRNLHYCLFLLWHVHYGIRTSSTLYLSLWFTE